MLENSKQNMPAKSSSRKIFPICSNKFPTSPELLYMEGELPPERRYLSGGGRRRRFTTYGKEACEKKIIGGLNNKNRHRIVIVSGLAIGIDGIAHKAALKSGLKTISHPRLRLGRQS